MLFPNASSVWQAKELFRLRDLVHVLYLFLDIRIAFLGIVKILQVKIEGLLSVEELIVDRRLELPVYFDADLFKSTVARLCRLTDFHVFRHVVLKRL